MAANERCSLPYSDSFIYEEDIPPDCKNCLGIKLDSDPGSDGYPTVRAAIDLDSKMNTGKDCKHGLYYWITGVLRGESDQRLIEVSAACDECDNFILNRYITICKI